MKQNSGWGGKLKNGLMLAALALSAPAAWAQSADPQRWQLNMGKGVTHTARMAWDAHMVALWVCVIIGLLVFVAMVMRSSSSASPRARWPRSSATTPRPRSSGR